MDGPQLLINDSPNLLLDAAAYVIWRAHEAGAQEQLGKTKLFKTLFLASWWAVQGHGSDIYNGPWYRIDRGPGLLTGQWELLETILNSRYGIETSTLKMWHGHPQVCFSRPTRAPQTLTRSPLKQPLDAAFTDVISLTADEAAAMTYDTEPMIWLIAEERAKWGGTTQYRQFNLRDTNRDKFLALASQYTKGIIEPDDIARQMGHQWKTHDVVVYLDAFGIHRSLEEASLSTKAKKEILAKLASEIRTGSVRSGPSSTEKALASARLEEEYVSPSSLPE